MAGSQQLIETLQNQDLVPSKRQLRRPKSFIWINHNGIDTSKCETAAQISGEVNTRKCSANTRKYFVRRSLSERQVIVSNSNNGEIPATSSRSNSIKPVANVPMNKESRTSKKLMSQEKCNITEMLEVMRTVGRMNYTKLIKLNEIDSLEKTAHEAESRLIRAEKMLKEDEKKFDVFLREYLIGNKEKEKQEQEIRDNFLMDRKGLEKEIRSLRLKISSIEQSIFQLEDMINDQTQIKTLLSRNQNSP